MASVRADLGRSRRSRSSSEGSGRRASLQNQCAVPSDKATSITTKANSATDEASNQSPVSSWGSGRTGKPRPRSFVHQRVAAPESLNIDPRPRPTRSHSVGVSSRERMSRRPASCSVPSRTPLRSVKVQRWDSRTRTVSDWDGLRRDPELWYENGDCLVHLYARGQSRRGASFRVPLKTLARHRCHAMFNFCFAHITDTPGSDAHSPTRVIESLDTKIPPTHEVELFIPVPASATKEEAFEWHLTTRNFFAYVLRKPLVGKQLGQALVDLEERIGVFCSNGDSRKSFLPYIESQGYRDLVDCPDYALAILYYAEHYRLRNIWIDAFAHCVGMNERLPSSPEYMAVSSLTKTLIVRAYLEMDINLGRATAAVREFLAEDVSPTHLGLTDGARAHMDRFQSFLQGFYIEKFGYWPPPKGLTFPKVMFRSMYNDFKNLYDYLVDPESSVDLSWQKPASGGICVLQNLESFDNRHKFPSLPHPLPLLPKELYSKSRIEPQRSFRTLSSGSKQNKSDRYIATHAALTAATNRENMTVTSSSIVQEYQRFERKWAQNCQEDKVSMTDARKVRWILIYGTLQYLISALRAPKEVRDTERPKYPLCCLIVEQSPWQLGTKALISPRSVSANTQETISRGVFASENQAAESFTNIQPDCHREQYFTHTNMDPPSRRMSVEIPAPLKTYMGNLTRFLMRIAS
ncbi:hypothetical protein DM02DRAFT_709669 [Periconia macrospinosa]|uniref:DUF8004 domain-containing protein n=1 Tax=Periconia macrospinosa TaxID=97972 RepID=A0A2V1DPV4_9PLEO|nr:hypothetical protein DM02DRAFT_709669 [Periconia macrospinosa]